jgi:hypothetical protein
LPYTALVRSYLSLLVRLRRQSGAKSEHAVTDVAVGLGLQRRRVWALYYGYRDRYARGVSEAEWEAMRERATEMLMREADELHRRADDLEAEIEQLKREHAEAPSWGSGPVSDCGGSK